MAISERAGRAGRPVASSSTSTGSSAAYHEIRPDPSDPAQRVAFGTSGHRGSSLNGAFNEAHIVATTEAICRYRASAGDGRPAVHRPRHARAVRAGVRDRAARCSSRTASTSASTPPTATRRRRPSRTRSSSTTAAARDRPRRRHRRHAVAQPARGRRLQVQPAQRRPGRHGRHRLDPGRGEPAARGRPRRRPAHRPRRARRAATTPYDFIGTYVDDLASVIDMEAIRASGLRLGVDPLGGASVAYWPAHRRALRPRPDRHERRRRPAVRVHDLRLGRPDPDGPVVAVRDGPAGRAARPVRRRVRQRHRRRPPRHRHARRRPAQPEPLPVGRGRVPVRRRARLGRGRRRRQDPRLERDDRPRRRRPRPAAARGPGRVQVVRRRASSTAASGSAARRAPGPRSCAATARSGRPTRTASSPACSRPR